MAAARQRTSPTAVTDLALVERLRAQLGDEVDGLEIAMATAPPVSIRVNTQKWSGPVLPAVPWCATGSYLPERPAFTFDPLLHAGAYYVQEASSMLLEQAVKASGPQDRPIIALDLCAAPGGKTTHLRSLLHQDSLLVANEIDRKRQRILLENIVKWGAPNTVVTGGRPSSLERLPDFFDLILIDAPCSGEGMFRKDPFAREQWSPSLVEACARVQQEIVQYAWSALRPGGCLVYSTCTWELAENEAQLAPLLLLGAEPMPLGLDPSWGIQSTERLGIAGARCYPHRSVGEGYFCAVLRKPGDGRPRSADQAKVPGGRTPTTDLLIDPSAWVIETMEEVQYAVHASHATSVSRIASCMHPVALGIPIAERKGDSWRPHAALALSTALDRDRTPTRALDHQEALAFLQGASLHASGVSGPALATFGDLGLGWLQGAGNRWNNRWPSAWRIRSHAPSAPLVSWAHAGNHPA